MAADDRANGRTYIVAAPEAPSGRQLYDGLRMALGMPRCTWAVSERALRLAARLGDGVEADHAPPPAAGQRSTGAPARLGLVFPGADRAGAGLAGEGVAGRRIAGDVRKVKRLFDLVLAVLIAVILAVPVLLVAMAVKLTSRGPALYWSDRVGRHNRIFRMPKFRTMRIGTPAVATHLLKDPKVYLTPIGSFLRKSSLDELPQLWSILVGDMSFVGPRPALFNQDDLVALRTERGVHELVPGLTGWAQVNGRDELPIPQKVELDVEYLRRRSLLFDLRILWLTVVKVLRRDGVSH